MDNIKTVEMVRCEITGKIVPANECEYVVIKILKHRDADINSAGIFGGGSSVATKDELFATKTVMPAERDDVVVLTREEMIKDRPRSVVPPAMLAFMTPAGNPGAAEEKRIV